MKHAQLTNQASLHVTTVRLKKLCKFASHNYRALLPALLHALCRRVG
jgi:hypothetical protein